MKTIRDEQWEQQKQQLQMQGYEVPEDAKPEDMQGVEDVYSESWAWEHSKKLNREMNQGG